MSNEDAEQSVEEAGWEEAAPAAEATDEAPVDAPAVDADPLEEAPAEITDRDAVNPYDAAVEAAKSGAVALPIMTDAGRLVDVA